MSSHMSRPCWESVITDSPRHTAQGGGTQAAPTACCLRLWGCTAPQHPPSISLTPHTSSQHLLTSRKQSVGDPPDPLPPPATHLLPLAQDLFPQGWLHRARYPQTDSEMRVLQASHLVITRSPVQCPFVLLFSFLPQSALQAGTSLPVCAAAAAFIKAPPPNQTPFVREMDARSSSAGTDAPECPPANTRCNIHLPGVPHACARCPCGLAVPDATRDAGSQATVSWVTGHCLLGYISAPSPWALWGLPCGYLSCSQHQAALLQLSTHPSRAGRVLLPWWCLHSCWGHAFPA